MHISYIHVYTPIHMYINAPGEGHPACANAADKWKERSPLAEKQENKTKNT